MKKSQILVLFIIYVSLSMLKISIKSETLSPELVRFGMEHTIYIYIYKMYQFRFQRYDKFLSYRDIIVYWCVLNLMNF